MLYSQSWFSTLHPDDEDSDEDYDGDAQFERIFTWMNEQPDEDDEDEDDDEDECDPRRCLKTLLRPIPKLSIQLHNFSTYSSTCTSLYT